MLRLVPGDACHLGHDGQGLPGLVGDGPHGGEIKVRFHTCCLPLLGEAILPV